MTILGLGGAWIAHDKSARDQKAAEVRTRAIIEAALEGGIRYFDTAPNYFLSEERLGPALAPVRDTVFLATKLDHPDAKAAEQDLMTSLKLLKTDHVDLLLLHGFYDRAFRYVLSVPGVYCALIGAASVDKVNRAVKAARENDS